LLFGFISGAARPVVVTSSSGSVPVTRDVLVRVNPDDTTAPTAEITAPVDVIDSFACYQLMVLPST